MLYIKKERKIKSASIDGNSETDFRKFYC